MPGTCRYDSDTGKLVITTQRKRGKKLVPLIVVYHVADARPDIRVANPAYTVTKISENGKLVDKWQVYHVSQSEWGVRCDCTDGEIREKRNDGLCKHAIVLQKIGLLK